MKLKDFLPLWADEMLIEVVYRSSSNGAYTAAELLMREEYLEKVVKCAEVRIEIIDDFVAEDSLFRKQNEFYEAIKERESSYICLELCEPAK